MIFNLEAFVCSFFLIVFILDENLVGSVQRELEYPCKSKNDCKDFGYVCQKNSCQCEQWYVPDKEKGVCLGGVDQKCLYDEHCIEGAYCMNQSICKCKLNSESTNNGLLCSGILSLRPPLILKFFCIIIGTEFIKRNTINL